MGSRANSTLFYGIHWDENEEVIKDQMEKEIDAYDINEKIKDKFPELRFKDIHCYETSYCLFIAQTYHNGDWDDLIDINLDNLNVSKEERFNEMFKEVCEFMDFNYKDPNLSLQSHYW